MVKLDYVEQPHVTISDVNWCIRAEFTGDDLERLARTVYRIKQTNTILYKDQYDIDYDADPLCLYTCIDYFVDNAFKVNTNVKIPNHVSKSPGETNDDKVHGITIAVAVLVVFIFAIVLNKVKSTLRK